MRRVVGPVAVIRDGAGRLRYLYQGAVLPDGLEEGDVERCMRRGLVAEFDDPEPVDLDDNEDDDESDDDDESGDDEDDDEDDESSDVSPRPKRAAGLPAWQEYRRAQGRNVEGLTKQELIDLDGN